MLRQHIYETSIYHDLGRFYLNLIQDRAVLEQLTTDDTKQITLLRILLQDTTNAEFKELRDAPFVFSLTKERFETVARGFFDLEQTQNPNFKKLLNESPAYQALKQRIRSIITKIPQFRAEIAQNLTPTTARANSVIAQKLERLMMQVQIEMGQFDIPKDARNPKYLVLAKVHDLLNGIYTDLSENKIDWKSIADRFNNITSELSYTSTFFLEVVSFINSQLPSSYNFKLFTNKNVITSAALNACRPLRSYLEKFLSDLKSVPNEADNEHIEMLFKKLVATEKQITQGISKREIYSLFDEFQLLVEGTKFIDPQLQEQWKITANKMITTLESLKKIYQPQTYSPQV